MSFGVNVQVHRRPCGAWTFVCNDQLVQSGLQDTSQFSRDTKLPFGQPVDSCSRNDGFATLGQKSAAGRLAMVMVVDTGPSIRCLAKDRCWIDRKQTVPARSRHSMGSYWKSTIELTRKACCGWSEPIKQAAKGNIFAPSKSSSKGTFRWLVADMFLQARSLTKECDRQADRLARSRHPHLLAFRTFRSAFLGCRRQGRLDRRRHYANSLSKSDRL